MSESKKWLKRMLIAFVLIITIPLSVIAIVIFVAAYPFSFICERTVEDVNIVCNQCHTRDFADCIYKHFPVGSDPEAIDRYLRALEFSRMDDKDVIVYVWRRNLYRVQVQVYLDEHRSRIVKLYAGL